MFQQHAGCGARWFVAASLLLLAVVGASCTKPDVEIVHFTVDREAVSYGESVTLSWQVVRSRDNHCRLRGESPVALRSFSDRVPCEGTAVVPVYGTTTFSVSGLSHETVYLEIATLVVSLAGVEVRVTPNYVELEPGASASISAIVTGVGDGNDFSNWSTSGGALQVYDRDYVPTTGARTVTFVAPAAPGLHEVVARARVAPENSATAVVRVGDGFEPPLLFPVPTEYRTEAVLLPGASSPVPITYGVYEGLAIMGGDAVIGRIDSGTGQ